MLAGGVLSWLVLIPLIVLFGSDIILYPGTTTIGEMYAAGGASAIWSTYIRYIGAGALAAGGIISLIKSLPLIVKTFGGGPVGIETIAAAVSEETTTIEDVIEPYLMQLGMLQRTPRGRIATREAYRYLGIPFPEKAR